MATPFRRRCIIGVKELIGRNPLIVWTKKMQKRTTNEKNLDESKEENAERMQKLGPCIAYDGAKQSKILLPRFHIRKRLHGH